MKTQFLTAAEVARVFRLREAAVYSLARQGLLPAVRLGRQLRFDPEALQEFVKRGGQALPGGWRREA